MALNLTKPQPVAELKPRIVVVGVGGAGGNAVNNMIHANLEGVEFVATNTDAQALAHNTAASKIQLGTTLTRGLGAGAKPDVGRQAAEETLDEVMEHLNGANMVFITAGMGGGTGTGAAPIIAQAVREAGILTVGVVTKPFQFEGNQRMRVAEQGIEELQRFVDTLIIIPNQNLFHIANEKTTFADAFSMADDVLYAGVRGVTDLMVMPGLINLDFADIRTVMSEMGKAMMGTGEAEGEERAKKAAEAAISNPLLEDVSMKGARGILINITGGMDMTLYEVDETINRIREEVEPDVNLIFGSTFDEKLEGKVRVSVVATGIDAALCAAPRPVEVKQPTEQSQPYGTARDSAAEDTLEAVTSTPHSVEEDSPENTVGSAAMGSGPMETAKTKTLFDLPGQQREEAQSAKQVGEEAPIRTQDAFIPPPPARAEAPTREKPQLVHAQPFAEADYTNAGRSEASGERSSKQANIFRRMTGLVTSKEDKHRDPPELSTPPLQENLEEDHEEPILEIPAFLRRQAN